MAKTVVRRAHLLGLRAEGRRRRSKSASRRSARQNSFGEVLVPAEKVMELVRARRRSSVAQVLPGLHPGEHGAQRRDLAPRQDHAEGDGLRRRRRPSPRRSPTRKSREIAQPDGGRARPTEAEGAVRDGRERARSSTGRSATSTACRRDERREGQAQGAGQHLRPRDPGRARLRASREDRAQESDEAMAKKVIAQIKLQIPAGAGEPGPPVGPALGQHGVNIMEFCKAFNAQTQAQAGLIIPVIITVYADRSFTFITKTPPASVLLKQAAGLEKGSGEPNENKVGQGDQGAGAGDRRDEDAGSERRRLEAGDAHGRGHGPQHGPRGRRLRLEHGERRARDSKTASPRRDDRPRQALRARARRSSSSIGGPACEVRRDRRAGGASGRRPAAGRPERPRHGRAAARHRQDRCASLVFAKGDKAKRGRGGRRRLRRRRGPRQEDHEEGWLDFDKAIATPDMMGVVGTHR